MAGLKEKISADADVAKVVQCVNRDRPEETEKRLELLDMKAEHAAMKIILPTRRSR